MLFCSLSTVLCSFYVCSLYIRSLQKIKKLFKEQIFLLGFIRVDYFCALVFCLKCNIVKNLEKDSLIHSPAFLPSECCLPLLLVQQTSLQAPKRNSEEEGVKILFLTGLLKQVKTNINALSNRCYKLLGQSGRA